MNESLSEKLKSFFTVPVAISLFIMLAILFIAVFAGELAPHDPNKVDAFHILEPPSGEYPLGTDKSGRDLLSRIFIGSRTTMLSAFCVVGISALVGIPLGMMAGYLGRIFDKLFMRVTDILMSFPSLLLAFVLVAAFGRGVSNVIVALGILYIPMLARLARSLVLVEKNKLYVEAAHSIGYSSSHIVALEILPNIISTLVVQMMLDIGYAVLDLSAMSFLGLGVQPPTADWGAMLEENRIIIMQSPLASLAPGLMIVVTVVSVNIFGDGVNAWFDPSQRKLPSLTRLRRLLAKEKELGTGDGKAAYLFGLRTRYSVADVDGPDKIDGAAGVDGIDAATDRPGEKLQTAAPFLATESLSVSIMSARGVAHAVRGVDIDIYPGEIVGLVGESGSGKSMTAKSIMRLNDEKALIYGGDITLDDEHILSIPEKKMQGVRGTKVSMIFQDPINALDPLQRVGKQIEEVYTLRGLSRKEAKKETIKILSDVGIQPAEERSRAYPFELSGGQLQRVMIAIALASGSKLLIADEPTTALDVTVQAQILDLIAGIRKKYGLSVLLITHDFGIIMQMCSRVSVMYAGKIVETGNIRDVFTDPRHPYTADLIASIPQTGKGKPTYIPGMPPDLRLTIEGCPYAPRCGLGDELCEKAMPRMREAGEGHAFACVKDARERQSATARSGQEGSV
ncbi:MAG: dipeptide/oligopeptide/nickel ABC transporter permease/ATP-binding protein [Clostridiales Family XIII bacterium]|jgi:peptide/nickel transport system permease protein|nr:dipeptide/oligopeptide/nickel ABC transporter permease/ATP-binding protein [Clostridiales Family XIII bacterium]